ncbi:MAG: hypothetical protein ABID09_03420 [Candidatus Omnitrophota bacterium]
MEITLGAFGTKQTRSISYYKVDTKEKAVNWLERAIDNPDVFVLSIRIYR